MVTGGGTTIDVSSSDPSPGAAQPAEPAVRLTGVRKTFGDVVAVADLTLDVLAGEFFTMLGPSGSGKTTTLRVIAGFELADAGRVQLHGVDVTGSPPYERPLNTVFQDYALFPHMSVAENVAYGLRVKGVGKRERRQRAAEALAMVRLPDLGERRPIQLSGGQRQRVALARALVNRPRVLLLDEPLGALDLKLREQMQVELKAIQREVGITFLFVTHDQDEALRMSDRIAVFDRGRIEQVGTAAEVYERPASAFVAGFVGTSNLMQGAAAEALLGDPTPVSIRPEKVRLGRPGRQPADGDVCAEGVVAEVVYTGATTRVIVSLDAGAEVTALVQNTGAVGDLTVQRGDRAQIGFDRAHVYRVSTQQQNDTRDDHRVRGTAGNGGHS
jgi:putative spermidine/putrescine transport system ATP-binding protein